MQMFGCRLLTTAVQQGADPLNHGDCQPEAMLSFKGLLQDCQQLWHKHLPELGEESEPGFLPWADSLAPKRFACPLRGLLAMD